MLLASTFVGDVSPDVSPASYRGCCLVILQEGCVPKLQENTVVLLFQHFKMSLFF